MKCMWSWLAIFACVSGVRGQHDGRCSKPGELCVPIRTCPKFQTRAAIIRDRPRPCAFSGFSALVCCDLGTGGGALSGIRIPLPDKCGLSVPRNSPPKFKIKNPVFAPVASNPSLGPFARSSFPTPAAADRVFKRSPEPQPQPLTIDGSTVSALPPGFGGGSTVSALPPGVSALPPGFGGGRNEGLEFDFTTIGGIDAVIGKWPWMVLFGRWTDSGLGDWFCGGVLITDRHVLTAAHCLRPEDAGAVGVLIGDIDLTRQDEVQHQERNVSRIVRHPHYLGSQNDLAVVRLAEPVQLTEEVSPICLPPPGTEHTGQDVEMAGWGLLEFAGKPSQILQEVALRVADPAECETAYRRLPQFETRFPGGFQGTKVCAESRDGEPRDACRGDSGGPLMALLPDERYQLVGVVSTGVGCGNPEFPGLYTKVSAYIDWITSQLT